MTNPALSGVIGNILSANGRRPRIWHAYCTSGSPPRHPPATPPSPCGETIAQDQHRALGRGLEEQWRWSRQRRSRACAHYAPCGGLPTGQCRNRCWTTCSASPAGVAAPRTFNPGSSSSSATGTRCDGWRRWRDTSATSRRPPWRSSWSWTAIPTRSSRRPSTRGCSASGYSWPPTCTGWDRPSAGSTGRDVKRPRLSSASRPSGWCGPPSPLATRMSAPRAPAPHPPQARKPLAELVYHERFGGA